MVKVRSHLLGNLTDGRHAFIILIVVIEVLLHINSKKLQLYDVYRQAQISQFVLFLLSQVSNLIPEHSGCQCGPNWTLGSSRISSNSTKVWISNRLCFHICRILHCHFGCCACFLFIQPILFNEYWAHPHVKTIGPPLTGSKLLSFLQTNPVATPIGTTVLTGQPALQIFLR